MTGSLSGAIKGAIFGAIGAAFAQGIGNYFADTFGLEHGATLWSSAKKGAQFLRAAAHGLSRGIISMAQGGTFKSGFASGFTSSFFSPGTSLGGTGTGGFSLRTTIAGIVGGTASALGGGKFANGAVSGAFVHMFNAEYDTLGKAMKGLWTKITDGEIGSDIAQGFKGGLEGYRQVRDNSPWYAQAMLKISMTSVELGLTAPLEMLSPVSIYVNSVSGAYFIQSHI